MALDQLRPCGVLILGRTESLKGITERFAQEEFQGAVCFRKVR